MKNKRFILTAIFIGGGGILGFGYYYFIGCAGGGCPIQSNPIFSTLYGGLLGFVIASFFQPKNNKKTN